MFNGFATNRQPPDETANKSWLTFYYQRINQRNVYRMTDLHLVRLTTELTENCIIHFWSSSKFYLRSIKSKPQDVGRSIFTLTMTPKVEFSTYNRNIIHVLKFVLKNYNVRQKQISSNRHCKGELTELTEKCTIRKWRIVKITGGGVKCMTWKLTDQVAGVKVTYNRNRAAWKCKTWDCRTWKWSVTGLLLECWDCFNCCC